MTTTKAPIIYTGSGSAIDNYRKPKPEGSTSSENWAWFDQNNAKHRLVLSFCHQAQWTTKVGNRDVVDLERLSNFLKSEKSPVKKKLSLMTGAEIEKIIKALKGIIKHTYK